jgi:hypothetical protein
MEMVAVVVSGMDGIELKPIRLRKSLYLLIPMEVAKLIGVTDKTKFVLTLKHGDEYVLMYHKVEGSSK